jgi:hypothetical protein
MVRRKKGRFISKGPMIGVVFASSSTRYKGDFTDKRMALVKSGDLQSEYVYNRKQYDVWPKSRYVKPSFRLLIASDAQHDTRILADDEVAPPNARIEIVPGEYREDFLTKPYDALRDIMGISNNALSPFIKTRHKIHECIEAGLAMGLESFLQKDHVILGEHGMPRIIADHYCQNPSRPRFVHIDLSRNKDRCGIAMIRFEGMREVKRSNGMTELLPVAVVEMACSIAPDANNEIDVAEIRAFVKHLKTRYGYPIKSVSYDGVDSRESIQQWRKDGMRAVQLTVDRAPSTAYKQFRDALYDLRILLPENDVLTTEILELEYDEKTDKVDHTVIGTKDVSDAVCGAYSNMLERKSTWTAAAHDDQAHEANQRAVFDERFDAPRN